MAKICSFCGESVGAMDQFTRMINGNSYIMCHDCAWSYDRFMTKRPETHEKVIPWYERVIADPKVSEELKTTLTEHRKTMLLDDISNSTTVNTGTGTSTAPYARMQTKTYSQPINLNTNQSGGSIWISVLKTVGIISIIVETIAGMIIGYSIGDMGNYFYRSSSGSIGGFFLGGLLGLFIGIVSASVLMTFADIAEDVKASRILAKQSDKHLAEIEKILKEKK